MVKSLLLSITAGLAALSTSAAAAPPAVEAFVAEHRGATAEDRARLATALDAMSPAQRRAVLAYLRADPRIVGGAPVEIAAHPWQVALIEGQEAGFYQFCGGSLIAPDVVVTAAHCIDNTFVGNDARRVDIVAGTKTYHLGGQRIDARAVFVHPQYNPSKNNDFDVAIIVLAHAATVGRPVPVDSQEVAVGTRAWVTGWGAIREGGMGTEDLLGAEVPVIDTQTCNASYAGGITAQMLCAGYRAGGVDSCQGDSGGPLTAGEGANARLIGIVSWGHGCARQLKYGVYTRVSSVAPWIQTFLSR